ncbi:MAG: hypothetical protein ACRDG4_18635, partial [Chloroflexota bacterium]
MAQPAPRTSPHTTTTTLEYAVDRTLAYFALFSYVPSSWETHRYLHGLQASSEQVRRALHRHHLPPIGEGSGCPASPEAPLPRLDPAREAGLTRVRRYGRILGYFPFARMIGLTGSRAMKGSELDDVDLMIVSAPGRVWLCRLGMVVAVRLARLAGDRLCPNYVVSANCLDLPEMTIYDAHELAQMIPLYGGVTYRALWARNPAVFDLLPNACPFPDPADRPLIGLNSLKSALERLLTGHLGDKLERWEYNRKVARLRRQGVLSPEISLTADQCKG